MVSSDGRDGTRGLRQRTKHVDHDLVAPCVLQASNALNGDVELKQAGHTRAVCMTTGDIDLAEDAIGDLPRYIFVVGCKGDIRFVGTRGSFKSVEKEESTHLKV